MHFNDHSPPQFHVYYAEQSAAIAIDPIQVLKGRLFPRVFDLVAVMGYNTSGGIDGKLEPV